MDLADTAANMQGPNPACRANSSAESYINLQSISVTSLYDGVVIRTLHIPRGLKVWVFTVPIPVS